LHTHSTFSDGTATPAELVRMASKEGLKAIALTDHDTMNGIPEAEAEAEKCGITLIRGCEISSSFNRVKVHVLGYFFDEIPKELTEIFEERRKRRHIRIKSICEKLQDIGVDINYSDVVENPDRESPGRANVAEALMKKGYTSSVSEGFEKYLLEGRAGYVENARLIPEEAIKLIKENNGKAFIAHLNQIKMDDEGLYAFLCDMKEKGLDGIEGYYSEYTYEQQAKYISFADKLGLKLCGGSDFHGEVKPKISLGRGFGNLRVPYKLLESIM